MPEIEGTGAYIIVDGERLPEYKIERESPTDVKCYIPSESGKVRFIHYTQ
jgi:hypothetical protein